MCSIFGLTKPEGHISDEQLRLLHKSFTSVASNACQRGKDSTGVVIISSTGRHLFKTLDSSDNAVLTKEWQTEVLNNIDKNTISVIGHTRAATTGDVTIRNAHPFKYGHIVGAHNGMIQNWDEIKGHKDKMQVDSEIIFSRLSRLKYKDALEELLGYYAVSFVDHNYRALHLAKETTAPLRLSYWKKAKTLFWGSTDTILKDGLKLHGLNLKTWDMPDDAILRFDTTRFDNKPFYTKQDIKPKQRYVSYNNAWNRNSYSTYTGWNNVWRNPSGNTKIECDGCGKKYFMKDLQVVEDDYVGGQIDDVYVSDELYFCNSCYAEMLQREGYQKCLFCDDEIIVTNDDDDELCMDCKSKNKMY
ncbi:glucosamine 6-phosphate synthetase [uncultured Mediterranean phage uvMED]|nr:glucosamine 6-phosphate synthetase [uncultured Mediterranean phage uvMED]